MTPFAVAACAIIAIAAGVAGCTDGTTPDCSGDPSPCGYDQPDAAGSTQNGPGTDGGSGDVLGG